ncbi:hypothetical protein OHA37_00575 [Streptomyces sp. NBC_00335]|uniref:hypothetical protein n=1 Tax=unclassified Streptomyces TaxID=2593676 RepID=UPI002255E265|nr:MULTISPECIES: hypothetical protein [unclassified Streptomyces]MCX5410261.1 hypothetical protein [Streptomyces sp. NBC_00086]
MTPTTLPEPSGQPSHGQRRARRIVVRTGTGVLLLLLLGTLLAGQPWNAPWWPGRTEVTGVPDPCEVISEPTRRLLPGVVPVRDPWERVLVKQEVCEAKNDTGSLRLGYEQWQWRHLKSPQAGEAAAHDRLQSLMDRGHGRSWDPVPGLGAEAYRDGSTVLVRKANVIVRVSYSETRTESASRVAEAEHLARSAVAALRR